LATLPAFLLSALPLSNVVSANLGINAINWAIILRLLLIGFAVTAFLLMALRPLVKDLTTRGVIVATFLLLMSFYDFVIFEVRSRGWNVDARDLGLAAGYTAFSLGIAVLVARPWKAGRLDPAPIAMIGIAVLGVNSYLVASRTSSAPPEGWRAAADRLATAVSARPGATGTPTRDIYYVVLDAFGRADTLKRYYGADLSDFETFLRSHGFFVADRARSNYAQTYLSLASLLNLNYLDPLVAAIGDNTQSYVPLDYVIQRNALMASARRAGYEVVGIGSDYEATLAFPNADRCYCGRHGLDGYTQSVIAATPLAALSGDMPYVAHRDKVLESFDALGATRTSARPRFVFAHIVSPHPPFIFSPDGSFRPPSRMFSFGDGSDFPGTTEEYIRGYRDQVRFVANRLTAFVQSVLARPGPKPVIVLHGDHGPGSMLQWEDPGATNMTERMDILAAYYFPQGSNQLYPSITPINGARALANEYLGANLPVLPDRTFFSTGKRPYRFIPVAPEVNPPATAGGQIAGH
jgi:hypothetical protein